MTRGTGMGYALLVNVDRPKERKTGGAEGVRRLLRGYRLRQANKRTEVDTGLAFWGFVGFLWCVFLALQVVCER